MAFAPISDITIGIYKRVKPHAVKINKSIYEFTDKAVIKLPITARIKRAGEVITESVETARQFTEGDKVLIKLGYNSSLTTEFEGFISRVNLTQPLEVECEGYSYQLRKKTYKKTFVNAQLKEVLQYLITGTDIILDKSIPDFKIDKMVLQNHSGTEVLDMIKKVSDSNIRLYFSGNVLYAGLVFVKTKADVKYRLGWNVIKDGNLKQRLAKNQDVTVNYIGEKKDGSKVKVKAKHNSTTGSAGSTGETKVIKTHAITDESTLNAMADAKLKSLSFDGYEGKITAFGIPYCEPGYRCILEDRKYVERGGNYLVESVEINYTSSGYRRTPGIGAKL